MEKIEILGNKKTQFQKDCEIFRSLIKEGKRIHKQAPSIRSNIEENQKIEKNGYNWFIKTRNFLNDLFGENFRDTNTFCRCFRRYSITNLLGTYAGDLIFAKEDVSRSIGVFEGTYQSFLEKRIKRRNKTIIHLSKIYHEVKDWSSILHGGKANDK